MAPSSEAPRDLDGDWPHTTVESKKEVRKRARD